MTFAHWSISLLSTSLKQIWYHGRFFLIIDFTQANLVSRAVLFHGVDVSLVAQVKEGLHHDHYLADVFSLLP
jgi:hypothetical protein